MSGSPYSRTAPRKQAAESEASAPSEPVDMAAEVRAMRLPSFRHGGDVSGSGNDKTIQFNERNISQNTILGQELPHIPYRWAVDPAGNVMPFCFTTNRGPNASDRDANYEKFRLRECGRRGWIFIEESQAKVERNERGVAFGMLTDEALIAEIVARRKRHADEAMRNARGSETQRAIADLKARIAESRALESSMAKMADAVTALAGKGG
jgi:hypothetical protein